MRITSRQLRQIIKEEVENMMREEDEVNVGAAATKNAAAGTTFDAYGKDDAAAAARKIESNAYMNITLGSSINQPFTSPKGSGILKIEIPPPTAPSQKIKSDILDQSGVSKLGMNPDGNLLMRAIVGRIARRMLPKVEKPVVPYTVKLPFTFEPGKLILGAKGGPVIGFGGGEDYDADKALGGVQIMGRGFR
jgi:hypothetical protein